MKKMTLTPKRGSLIALCLLFSLLAKGQTNVNLGTNAGNAGSGNVSIGYTAGDVVTGTDNVFVGYTAGGLTTTGLVNTFVGAYSGRYNTTGHRNCFYGYFSGPNNTIGAYNTLMGTYSGYSLTSGSNNTFLGTYTGYNNINGSGNVFLGFNAGYNETGSNKLYIDNSDTSTPLVYGDFSTNKIGINALPNTTHTLTVGGTIHSTGVYVNGVSISGDISLWNRNGSNVNTDNLTDNIGIGVVLTSTNNPNSYKLAVNGKIGAKEVQIENTSITWSDFVFYDDYKLRSLPEVEAFIKANGHLPEIPSEKQVKEEGIKLAEMNAKLLQKIEELTLYVIELKKEVDDLKKSQN